MNIKKILLPGDYLIIKDEEGRKIEIKTKRTIEINIKTIEIENYEYTNRNKRKIQNQIQSYRKQHN